jgi:hypothetical protein
MALVRVRTKIWVPAAVAAVVASACNFSPPLPLVGDGPKEPDAAVDAQLDAALDGPRGDWWDANYKRRRPITIDTSKLTAGAVTNFPLLVRIPQGLIDLNANRSNALRFVSTDNTTVFEYELDLVNNGGTSFVWVRMPSLNNTAGQTTLWLYYENAAAPPASAGNKVFQDLYVSVHHLSSTADSTGNGHTATAVGGGGGPANVDAGQIGRARDFDGNDDYYELAGETAYDFTTSLTVSAWVRRQTFDETYQAIVCKGDRTWRMHRELTTQNAGFGTTTGGAPGNDNLQGATNIDNNNWHHVAIVFGGGVKRLYVDGQQDAMRNLATIDTDDTPVQIGHNSNAQSNPDRYWNGLIDEVRISSTAYNAAWIFAEHLTVTDPTFVTIGNEERY